MTGLLPAVLSGAAVAVLLAAPPGPTRLADALPPAAATTTPEPGAQRAGRGHPGRRRTGPGAASSRDDRAARAAPLACLLAGGALLLVVGGPLGLLLAGLVAGAGPVTLSRLEPRQAREHRERLAHDLPLALDLMAACLAGGAALPNALRVVADATPGPCGEVLAEVAAALDVGTAPQQAWALLAGPDEHGLAGAASRALTRAGEGGAPVATAVAVLAAQARARSAADCHRAAARAGVLAVGPLGLCFLPAFVLLGVVPVVAGLVGPLLAAL